MSDEASRFPVGAVSAIVVAAILAVLSSFLALTEAWRAQDMMAAYSARIESLETEIARLDQQASDIQYESAKGIAKFNLAIKELEKDATVKLDKANALLSKMMRILENGK